MQPPPGYPFVGPLASRPPPPLPPGEAAARSFGVVGFVLVFSSMMMGAGFLLVVLVVGQMRPGQAMPGPEAVVPESVQLTREPVPAPAGDLDPSPRSSVDSPAPPALRNVPTHPARFLEGCSAGDLDALEESLSVSIGRGAPLFNDGDVTGCADEYERAATKLEGLIPASCLGPRRALSEGKATATQLGEPNARAWALRDAFDGIIEVIERSRSAGVENL